MIEVRVEESAFWDIMAERWIVVIPGKQVIGVVDKPR